VAALVQRVELVNMLRASVRHPNAEFVPACLCGVRDEPVELFVAGHDAMITQPRALATILMDLL
jgi:hypothetical protein